MKATFSLRTSRSSVRASITLPTALALLILTPLSAIGPAVAKLLSGF